MLFRLLRSVHQRLRRGALFLLLTLFGLVAVSEVRSEVPFLTPDQLLARSQVIAVGPVVEHAVDVRGSETRYTTVIRALKVEKGVIREGELVTAKWSVARLPPGQVGSSGHVDPGVSLGQSIKVFVTGDKALLPNGLAKGEALVAKPELLASSDAAALVQAGRGAFDKQLYAEAESIFKRAVELRQGQFEIVMLAACMSAQNRFQEAVTLLTPIATAPLPPAAPPQPNGERPPLDQDLRKVAELARRGLFRSLWDANDGERYLQAAFQIAAVDNTRPAWEFAERAALHLKRPELQERAAKELEKLGPAAPATSAAGSTPSPSDGQTPVAPSSPGTPAGPK